MSRRKVSVANEIPQMRESKRSGETAVFSRADFMGGMVIFSGWRQMHDMLSNSE